MVEHELVRVAIVALRLARANEIRLEKRIKVAPHALARDRGAVPLVPHDDLAERARRPERAEHVQPVEVRERFEPADESMISFERALHERERPSDRIRLMLARHACLDGKWPSHVQVGWQPFRCGRPPSGEAPAQRGRKLHKQTRSRAPVDPARPLLAHADAARRAQTEFGLCDACLGRRFGKVETGLSNPERARVFGLPQVDVKACWLCEGLFGELDALAEVALEALAPYEHRHFLVGTKLDPAFEIREAEINASLATSETAERSQSEVNREVGKRVAARTGKPVEFKNPDITVIVDARFFDAELQFGALYIFGRYRKLDRTIPQTRWPCNRCNGRGCDQCALTGHQYANSVQALVAAPFLDATGATQEAFHGAGREDIDARCIGEGRPFVLEIKDPRTRSVDLAPMPERIRIGSQGRVEVHALRFTTKVEVAHVKEHGGGKTYRARVAFAAPVERAALVAAIDALRGQNIQQRTPQRVEHRRADLVRDRRVRAIALVAGEEADLGSGRGAGAGAGVGTPPPAASSSASSPSFTSALIEIHGDAGLYIKELVSGDEGRTEPSLAGLLGIGAKVAELDIIGVDYEPPAPAPDVGAPLRGG